MPDDAHPASTQPTLSRRALLRRAFAFARALPATSLLAACGAEAPQVFTPGSTTLIPVVAQPTEQASASPLPSPSPAPSSSASPAPSPSLAPFPSDTPTPAATRFAVIGDFGANSKGERDVAAMIASWGVEFIVTVGDNNYPDGAAATIDENVGQFYHAFLNPYKGKYGDGADRQRFFATLGNHDWVSAGARPALAFFAMPARYYSFTWGSVEFFMVDSDPNEPDGIQADSTQGKWLRLALAASQARWKLVAFHHPPFSSGLHGPSKWMQWPFEDWGAHAVLSGHDHTYERIARGKLPYFVNGLGGASRYDAGSARAEGSQIFYNAAHGAMRVTAGEGGIDFEFVAVTGEVIDRFSL